MLSIGEAIFVEEVYLVERTTLTVPLDSLIWSTAVASIQVFVSWDLYLSSTVSACRPFNETGRHVAQLLKYLKIQLSQLKFDK